MTTTAGEPPTGDHKLPPRRSRRLFALPSAVVLLVAIFMPLVKVCGDPAYPIQVPMFWGPYVLAGLVIGMAMCTTGRGLRGLVIAAQLIVLLQWGGFGLVSLYSGLSGGDTAGLPWGLGLLGATYGFWLATRRGPVERRGATTVLAIGVVCLPWFALFVVDPDGMWGAYVSLGAALALILSGLEWRRELRHARVDAVPQARLVG